MGTMIDGCWCHLFIFQACNEKYDSTIHSLLTGVMIDDGDVVGDE